MGNCAGYCVSEAEQNKQKVTVEQRDGGNDATEGRGVAYINDARGEFEIEYAQNKQMGANRVDVGAGYQDM